MIILRDLSRDMGDENAAARFDDVIGKFGQELNDPEAVRIQGIEKARENFTKTGRDLFDPPE